MKQRSIPPVYDNPVFSVEISKCEGADSKNENSIDNITTPDNVQRNASSKTKKGNSQLTPRRIRKEAIMVIIAGAFSLTFLVALAFGYVFAVRDFNDFSSLGDIVMLFCCYRFYFINYSLNPLVYFILDSKIRKHVKHSLLVVVFIRRRFHSRTRKAIVALSGSRDTSDQTSGISRK